MSEECEGDEPVEDVGSQIDDDIDFESVDMPSVCRPCGGKGCVFCRLGGLGHEKGTYSTPRRKKTGIQPPRHLYLVPSRIQASLRTLAVSSERSTSPVTCEFCKKKFEGGFPQKKLMQHQAGNERCKKMQFEARAAMDVEMDDMETDVNARAMQEIKQEKLIDEKTIKAWYDRLKEFRLTGQPEEQLCFTVSLQKMISRLSKQTFVRERPTFVWDRPVGGLVNHKVNKTHEKSTCGGQP